MKTANFIQKQRFQLLTLILFLFIGLPFSFAQFIQADKYPSTIKVACVGNSITYGSTIEPRDSLCYPAQLGRLLGKKWEVKNFGISGRTLLSKGDKPYIKEQIYADAKAYQPDIVLIKLGTNDTKPQNWKFKNEFETDYKALIKSFQELDSKPIVVLLKAVPAFPENWGIRDSLIRLEVNPTVQKIASEMNLLCIDLYTPLKNRTDLFPDKIHPNAEGAGIMAKVIFQELTFIN
jgi:lysophospholipase L1-like esterase